MTLEQFLTAAQAIEADPLKRLSKVTKELIERDNYVYDAHVHIFDRKCVPVLYFVLRFLAESLDQENAYKALEDEEAFKKSEKIDLERTINNEKLSNKDVLKIVLKKDMNAILDYFNQNFALNNFAPFLDKESLAVILTMDLECGWGKKTKRSFKEQIIDLQNISKQKPILPFFALDPRRADKNGDDNLYELFIKAFINAEAPYFGVKCYPALGYLPSDARLAPIFEVCNEKNIPIVTHCGGNIVSTYKKSIDVVNSAGQTINVKLPIENRDKRAEYLNDPLHWDSVLNRFNNLKINFAHFGGSTPWASTKPEEKLRIEHIVERMQRYENRVFTDFSFNLVDTAANSALKARYSEDIIKNRTMYGTDYWVVLPKNDLKDAIQKHIDIMGSDMLNMANSVPDSFLFGKDLVNESLSDILASISNGIGEN